MIGNQFYTDAMGSIPEQFRKLSEEQWGPTPWMIDVFFGHSNSYDNTEEMKIKSWLYHNLGPESSPMHGKEGLWHRAHVTLHGWSWVGFKTEDLLRRFLKVFPQPERQNTCRTPTI
jgi:hypothetical protein